MLKEILPKIKQILKHISQAIKLIVQTYINGHFTLKKIRTEKTPK